jgi:tRNA(Arg) A34 adenosine deaminase TadA
MNRKILNFFEVAARTATSKDDRRAFFLGAIGIRNDGAMVKAMNSPSENKNRYIHAEYRLSRKLDYNAEVYVARVRMDNYEFGMARPCEACRKALRTRRVRRVFYTIDKNQYGVIDIMSGSEKIYTINGQSVP